MRNIFTLILLFPLVVFADRLTDKPLAGVSPSGEYIVKIENRSNGIAKVYKYEDEKYKKVSEFSLAKAFWLPTDVVISSEGNIYTISNRLGDPAVVIYDKFGKVQREYALEKLVLEYAKNPSIFPRTVSTVRWVCSGFKPWFNGNLLLIKLSSGHYLSLLDGNITFNHEIDRRPCQKRL